jgi:hypothetical protein
MLSKLLDYLNKKKSLEDLGPLYHSYRLFGIQNQQLPGIFQPNQACKEPVILSYILLALAKCRANRSDTHVTFAELFCADGYYAMAARHLGVSAAIGIDNNRDGYFAKAKKISDRLGIDCCTFIQMDINDIDTLEPIDIVANIGGLYHIDNPEEILDKSYILAKRFLIVQTVVSLTSDNNDYYESPAPGWTWGNRYSRQSFEKLIESKGWNIIDRHFNILEGNARLEDKGSVYFLIQKDN